ncbi:MAG: hypothetical protein A2Y21_11430 [Clostridiales bacterium GWC2_40_7]|nr:MAG: hypothetical protein A2Y21_11430 [Clostridiales bacterium GWC2_40_7]
MIKFKRINALKIVGFFKSRLFIKFILSYILIMIVPMILVLITVYGNLINMLTEEVEKSTLNNLSQTMDNIEMRISEISYIAVQLPENLNVKPIFFPEKSGLLSMFDYYTIIRELNDYKSTNSFIESISIYVYDTDTIVGTNGKVDFSMFYNTIWDNSKISESTFRNIMGGIPEGNTKTIEIGRKDNIGRSLIVYMRSLPVQFEGYKTILIATMNSYPINRLLLNALVEYDGAAYILDESNKVITTATTNINVDIQVESFMMLLENGKNPVYSAVMSDNRMIVSHIKSKLTGWSYIAIIPSQQILSRVNEARIWSLIIFFIASAAGLFLASYFSFKNYSPIKKITDTFLKEHDNKRYENELDMIDNAMSLYISKTKMLQKRLDSNMPLIRSEFLTRLLRGEILSTDDVLEMLKFTELDMVDGVYTVMAFCIDDYDEFVETYSESTQNLYKFSIANVAEEFGQQIGKAYAVRDGMERVVLIVNLPVSSNIVYHEMESIGRKVISILGDNFNFSMTAGIGQVYNTITDISKSYLEARTAIDYKMVKGKGRAICFNEIDVERDERYYYSNQHEGRIMNCLKAGDFDGIQQVLSGIFKDASVKYLSVMMARCVYFNIINTAMKALTEFGTEDYNQVIREGNILPDFIKCETLDEIYQQTLNFYKTICNRVNTTRETTTNEFREKILGYIEANYCDANLSLYLLADKFNVTPSFLSRYFKNNINAGFVDYVHSLRLKKAKKLLINGDARIEDIGRECGYVEKHTFIKTFKKYEGITPGKFREIYSDNNPSV